MTDASVARRLLGEAERVADVVGDVLDLGHLVVVREDHGVALRGERADLGLERADVVELERGGGGAAAGTMGSVRDMARRLACVFA